MRPCSVRNAAWGSSANQRVLQITRDAESAAAEYSGTQGDESDASLTDVHSGKPPGAGTAKTGFAAAR